jgi:hypothetical protein
MNNDRTRYLRHGGHGRIGARQLQALRLARLRSEATSLDLMRHMFPRLPRSEWQWHHWRTCARASSRFWERCGRVGRYLLWRAKIDANATPTLPQHARVIEE